MLTDFHEDEAKKIKMADFQLPQFLIFLRKFQGLVLGLVGLIDAKGIDVAQKILRIGGFENLCFFESAISKKNFQKKDFFSSFP